MMRFSAWKRSVPSAASVLSVSVAIATAALTGCGGAKDAGNTGESSNSDVTSSTGSGGSAGTSEGANALPAGCSQTVCDANEKQCIDESSSQCKQCEDICVHGTDPSCFDTCSNICDDPTSTTLCEKVAADCRQTTMNTQCADAPATTGSAAPTGDDAGVSTAADSGGGDDASAPACTPFPPSNLNWPTVGAANPRSCTTEELEAVATACADDLEAAGCRAAIAQVSSRCGSCLTPPANQDVGPVLTDANGLTYLNQAGCIDIVKPGCGNQWGPVVACEIDACPCGDKRCVADADLVCGAYTTALTTFCETSDILDGACFPEPGQTSKDFTLAILATFCQ